MTLSPNANWIAAMSRQGLEVRHLVAFFPTATVSRIFSDGPCDSFVYPESIIAVTPVSRELDPVEGAINVSSLVVKLIRDPLVEQMVTTYAMKNAAVQVLIGEASLDVGDFEDEGIFLVDRLVVDDTTVTLHCKTPEARLSTPIMGYWITKHPLEACEEIIGLAGVPSRLIDTASFSPADAAHADIKHWNINRAGGLSNYWSESVLDPIPARDLLNELCELLGGFIYTAPTGKLTFKIHDLDSAVADTWTDDDLLDFEILSVHEPMINRVTAESHPFKDGATDWDMGSPTVKYMDEDTDAQARFGIVEPGVGSDDSILAKHFDKSDWVTGAARILPSETMTAGSPAAGATFTLVGSTIHGMCGADPTRPLTDDLTMYLILDDEIIELDRFTVTGFATAHIQEPDYGDGSHEWADEAVINKATVRVKTRGALGTTAASHSHEMVRFPGNMNYARDITLIVALADRLLTRFANGMIKLRCKVGPSKWKYEIGDLIALSTSRFIGYGRDGLDGDTKFQVIGRKPDLYASGPGVEYILGYASEAAPPASTRQRAGYALANLSLLGQSLTSAETEEVGELHTVTGLTVSDGGGLNADVAPGKIANLAIRVPLTATTTVALTATRDNYLAFNLDGAIEVEPVAVAAAAPEFLPGSLPIAKVTTDGAGVTAIVDLRVTQALDGQKLVAASVDTVELADAAVETAKIANSAVETAKLDNDAVTTAKIDDEAVSTPKVAQYAIGTHQTATDSIGRNHNFDFSMFTRG